MAHVLHKCKDINYFNQIQPKGLMASNVSVYMSRFSYEGRKDALRYQGVCKSILHSLETGLNRSVVTGGFQSRLSRGKIFSHMQAHYDSSTASMLALA